MFRVPASAGIAWSLRPLPPKGGTLNSRLLSGLVTTRSTSTSRFVIPSDRSTSQSTGPPGTVSFSDEVALIAGARSGLFSSLTRRTLIRRSRHRRARATTTTRNPILLLRLSGVFLLRLAERQLLPLLFHEPPRKTRSGAPRFHPLAKTREEKTSSRNLHVSPCSRCAIQLRIDCVTFSNPISPFR